MTRHSQNRTASPHFSYAERQALGHGTKRARVGSEAFRSFNACALCLNPARDPRVCAKGHIFCNECIISDLVRQKQDIKRQQILVEKMRAEEVAEREVAIERARARVLEDFEKAQQQGGSRAAAATKAPSVVAGVKRKLGVDADEVEQLIKEAEEKALKQLDEEQKASRSAKLPNFWLPSMTPSAAPAKLEDVKLQTLCRAGTSHPLNLKNLSEVSFNAEGTATAATDSSYSCWACRRSLTNNLKIVVLRPCGHALCGDCGKLGVESQSCPTCDTRADVKNGFIELAREGTGFASGGQVEVKRFDLAFQG